MKKAAVMGWPVDHSLSPRLHTYWLKKHNIQGSYEALAVTEDRLSDDLRALKKYGFVGVNLTVPHKQAAVELMDHLDPLAKQVGAINTVLVREDGSLEGRNTDVYGFTQNLITGGYKPDQRPVAIIGAGGAARAAVAGLLAMGIDNIRVLNRTQDRAEEMAESFGKKFEVFALRDTLAFENVGLLVNATSLGMEGQPLLELGFEELPHDAWVMDMVYAPLETKLLKRARKRENPTIDGLGMLLHQAKPAFAAFFGVEPEVTEELREHVLEKE